MDWSTPNFPVLHHLLKFAQTHVYSVSDAIQPPYSLSPCYPSAFNLSQHQDIFQCQLFLSAVQSIRASASTSVLPMNIQGRFPLGLTDLISLQSKGLWRVFFNTTVWKQSVLRHSAFFMVQLPHLYTTTGKTIALTMCTFVGKVMSLLFNMLSRFVMTFFQGASVF